MNSIQIKERSDTVKELQLSGRLNIELASELLLELKNARSTCPHLIISSERLESMDTSVLQVLYAANQAFETVVLEKSSPGWEASFKRAGLSDPFTAVHGNN